MPVVVRKIGDKYRVVEKATGTIIKGPKGNSADGGGHNTAAKAQRQATAINISQSRQRGR